MLSQLLSRTLSEEPGRPLLESNGRVWTAAELEESARRLAGNLMDAGVESGDRVAFLLPNRAETVIAYLACFKANFVVVPLDYRNRPAQIEYALSHSGAVGLIVHRDRLPELEQEGVLSGLPHVLVVGAEPADGDRARFEDFTSRATSARFPEHYAGDDLCAMIYTSGTTSRPKGVTLTRRAIEETVRKYLACVPLTKEDVALIALPLTRPMPLRTQLLPLLYLGGRVCLIERFEVEAYLAALRRPPAKTYLILLPAALAQLLSHPDLSPDDFAALRLCVCGGDYIPPRLHEKFERLTGVALTEQCGATEVGPYAMNPPFGRKKPGSVGLPMYGAQVCLVNERGEDVLAGEIGEILVSSPMMMDGYWNDTAQTRRAMRDGRYRTGDLGRFDEDGYLWLLGRKKDVIVRGGPKISPLEVESVLLSHPAVGEACVVGALDPVWGQAVHAYIVAQPGQAPIAAELTEFSKGRLADYMVPEKFHFIDTMPLKGPGKIDRDLLRMRAEIGPLFDKVPFFRNAGEEFLRDVVPCVVCRSFDAGAVIVRQGDIGDAMFFLTRGQVEVVRDDTGERVNLLTEGDYFGEVAILMKAPRLATVRALVECEVYELKSADVLKLAQAHPDFARAVEESARRLRPE